MPKKPPSKTALATRSSKKSNRKRASVRTATQVVVVNMIPRSLSGEAQQDSEPTIAVNPANPQQIAASAFTPDPGHGNFAPIFTSVDGGNTWTLKSIVPSSAGSGSKTADITVSFSTAGNRLYAGIIRLPVVQDRTRLNVLRTNDFQSGAPMKVIVDRTGEGVDQPYVRAVTVASGPDRGKDRVYVGDNDFNATPGSATIDQSLDAGKTNPTFKSVRIESRTTSGQDGPTVRPAIHLDGTVYAVFHSWRTFSRLTGEGTADVVVVRDDSGGNGTKKFQALVDPSDGKAGKRVVTSVKFNFDGFLGKQRTGGDVSIAVDPTNSSIVYIAYNDDIGSDYVLHVLRSTDRGATWSGDLRTVRNALNGALAVNSAGKVGFLYQQLSGSGASQRWVTQLETSTDGGATWTAITLATVAADKPDKQFDPYLGDYDHVMSVGKDFYGIFSASNVPNKANFPQGVTYQRNANFTTQTLLDVDNTTTVRPSIDPFFFKVTG
jgi:hypothetical protein